MQQNSTDIEVTKMAFKVGILVVSDTCSKDPSQDQTGPALISYFDNLSKESKRQDHNYEVSKTAIVADVASEIQRVLINWSSDSEDIRLILTCGGTGFTKHDITPEAVSELITRPAPGIVHAMLTESLRKTPYAIMARPVAGVIGKTLVITLPGSPRGAKENFGAVSSTLCHALAQLEHTGGRELHMKMNRTLHDTEPGSSESKLGEKCNSDKRCGSDQDQDHNNNHNHKHEHNHEHNHDHDNEHNHDHSHSHNHNHHGLVKHTLINQTESGVPSVVKRPRKSPYPMLEIEDALQIVLKNTLNSEVTTISIEDPELIGSILSKPIVSPMDVPNFPASIVDGYAVVSTDGPGVYPLDFASCASAHSEKRSVESGLIARVTTGAPVPAGADAVVMVEETEVVSTQEGGKEEDRVLIKAQNVKPGDNIRKPGSDLSKGAEIFAAGHQITNGGEIGLLASVGIREVSVYRKPRIGVLSTGDELRNYSDTVLDTSLSYGEVFDSNRPSLISLLRQFGFKPVDLGIVRDNEGQLEETLDAAINGKLGLDYLITSGGVSMGEKDYIKPVIQQKLNGKIHFGRIRMKPGKPTTFATVKRNSEDGSNANGHLNFFALPGNPASACVAMLLLVIPSLRKFQGLSEKSLQLTHISVRLAEPMKLDATRVEYPRVQVFVDENGDLVAKSTGMQRSSRIGSFKNANALLRLPSEAELHKPVLEQGERATVLVFGHIGPL